MTTPELVERFARLVLFAQFMREEVPDPWNLMVSARWTGGDSSATVEYLVAQIESKLGDRDLVSVSRIVLIDTEDAPSRSSTAPFILNTGASR